MDAEVLPNLSTCRAELQQPMVATTGTRDRWPGPGRGGNLKLFSNGVVKCNVRTQKVRRHLEFAPPPFTVHTQ
eukprot:1274583-Rhodomonas_salina.1